jgi:cytochrome c oxidase assembly factor CtaG
LVNTAFSASLTFAPKVIYPSYAAAPRVFDLSPLADQAAAGALMWVIGSIFYLVPVAVIAHRLLSPQPVFSTPTDAPYLKADPQSLV